MSCSEFYAELKGWQALIGSLLGFLALLGGALFNAHLNRKRDDRLQSVEAHTVALSLYGEINLLRNDLAAMANGIGSWYTRGGHSHDELPEHYRDLFVLRDPTLYKALSSKIGLLEANLLLPITKFYADYEAAIGHFPKLFKNEERKISYGVEWVLSPAVDAVEQIEGAIRRIEMIGMILDPAITPRVEVGRSAIDLAEALQPDHDD